MSRIFPSEPDRTPGDGFLASILELRRRLLIGQPITLGVPDAFPAYLDRDVDDEIEAYLSLLARYPFQPPLAPNQRTRLAVDAVLESGGSYAARALSLVASTQPGLTVQEILGYIKVRGVHSPRETDQTHWIVEYLLDDPRLAGPTIRTLTDWKGHPDLEDILRSEAARLPVDW